MTRLVAAVVAALPLSLLLPGTAGAALPTKNTTYADDVSAIGVEGTISVKVGSDRRTLKKVTVKLTCDDGPEKVVFKNVAVSAKGDYDVAKGGGIVADFVLGGTFMTKHVAEGRFFAFAGPCANESVGYVAED